MERIISELIEIGVEILDEAGLRELIAASGDNDAEAGRLPLK